MPLVFNNRIALLLLSFFMLTAFADCGARVYKFVYQHRDSCANIQQKFQQKKNSVFELTELNPMHVHRLLPKDIRYFDINEITLDRIGTISNTFGIDFEQKSSSCSVYLYTITIGGGSGEKNVSKSGSLNSINRIKAGMKSLHDFALGEFVAVNQVR